MRALRLAAAALLLAASGAVTAQIPALEEVPRFLPEASRVPLEARYAELAARRDSLRARIRDHDARCRLYSSNAPEATTCPPAKIRLSADREAYVTSVKTFNWDLEQSIGDYRIFLEKGLARAEEALVRDAEAVKRLGFERRAEDFKEWERLSADARNKLSVELTKFIVDEGGEAVVKSFAATLQGSLRGLDPGEARELARKLEQSGLGSSPSARALREYASRSPSRAELIELATMLHKDIQTLINAGSERGLERALELIKLFGGDAIEKYLPGLAIGELAVWSTYSAAAQSVAVIEVSRLNRMTDRQLKGLASIRCVTERHMAERYGWLVKMAEFRGTSAPTPAPAQSAACRSAR